VEIEFETSGSGLINGTVLEDTLGPVGKVPVANGKVKVSLPARTAAIFERESED
jgi:hypothetical protein